MDGIGYVFKNIESKRIMKWYVSVLGACEIFLLGSMLRIGFVLWWLGFCDWKMRMYFSCWL